MFCKRSLSTNCTLKCGIPQGTILGPPLLLIFVNLISNSHPRMYADDTNLTYSGNDINTIQLNLEDLLNAHEWLISNKLILNLTKAEYMLIRSRQRQSTLSENYFPEINGILSDRAT